MLEIDGEFFEDPCELIKIGRTVIIMSMLEQFKIQVDLVSQQPLFPKFTEGEIINICKDDIVHPKLWDMESNNNIICQPKSEFVKKIKIPFDYLDMMCWLQLQYCNGDIVNVKEKKVCRRQMMRDKILIHPRMKEKLERT